MHTNLNVSFKKILLGTLATLVVYLSITVLFIKKVKNYYLAKSICLYAIAFRKKIYRTIEELQADLDKWMYYNNNERTHSGKHCFGKTPIETLKLSIPLAKQKLLEKLKVEAIFESYKQEKVIDKLAISEEKKTYSEIQSDN